jgi:hypothetical protein
MCCMVWRMCEVFTRKHLGMISVACLRHANSELGTGRGVRGCLLRMACVGWERSTRRPTGAAKSDARYATPTQSLCVWINMLKASVCEINTCEIVWRSVSQ